MPVFNPLSAAKKTALVIATCALANVAIADCERPELDKPEMPNGAESSLEDMLATQKLIKDYVAQNTVYTECMDESGQMDPVDTTEMNEEQAAEAVGVQEARIAEYNAAVDDMQSLSAGWSETMKAYKEANAK